MIQVLRVENFVYIQYNNGPCKRGRLINTNNKYNIYIIVFGELHDKTNNKKINEGEIIRFNELANQNEQKYIVTEQTLMLETKLYLFNNLINTNTTFSKKYFDTLECS